MKGYYIKNYFKYVSVERWNYESFYDVMKVLEYSDDDKITRNYIRELRAVYKYQNNEIKRNAAKHLLDEAFGIQVFIYLSILFNILFIYYDDEFCFGITVTT